MSDRVIIEAQQDLIDSLPRRLAEATRLVAELGEEVVLGKRCLGQWSMEGADVGGSPIPTLATV